MNAPTKNEPPAMIEPLYKVFTHVDRLPLGDCFAKDVFVCWFVDKRQEEPRSWRDFVVAYDSLDESDRIYTEILLDGLFTESEAKQLLAYLELFPGTHGSQAVELPVEGGVTGVSALSIGGLTGHLVLSAYEDYPLQFEVRGYYDLRGCDFTISTVQAELGRDYLKEALSCLALEEPPDEHLLAVAETLFERGLYVGKRAGWESGPLDVSALDMNDPIPF